MITHFVHMFISICFVFVVVTTPISQCSNGTYVLFLYFYYMIAEIYHVLLGLPGLSSAWFYSKNLLVEMQARTVSTFGGMLFTW